jgi:spore germination protein GerM
MTLRTRKLATALVVAATFAAACGVPEGPDTFEQIADADVPLNLASPSTTTTTTTTTVPVEPPETTTTAVDPLPEPETEPVRLYFLARDELIPTRRSIETGFVPFQLIELLAAGPDPETNPGLETVVPDDLVRSIDVTAGTATVDLDSTVFRRVLRSDQLALFAQIVLTLTESAPRIGIVTFTIDGAPENVPIPNNFFRRTLTFDNYAQLIVNAVVTPTVTTTVPPTTTVPEGGAEGDAEGEPPIDDDVAADELGAPTTVPTESAVAPTTAPG